MFTNVSLYPSCSGKELIGNDGVVHFC
uniref:Uncharacterized protein n=1 Tax=Anguilla anguilla TaxID=7936 RepID=A0A0E9R1F5_ANGAN